MFTFKKFTLIDEHCAMKVGTDGTLLGAWIALPQDAGPIRVLDVGAGCGLISLMLAQRFASAHITALDIDEGATADAICNIRNAPFGDRVEAVCEDFLAHKVAVPYAAIVSNPPFFEETLLPPNQQRAMARHTSSALNFSTLIAHSKTLLQAEGTLHLIVPATAAQEVVYLAHTNGFSLVRRCVVHTVAHKPARRVMLSFVLGQTEAAIKEETLLLNAEGERTAQYKTLCRDFYL